MSSLPFLLDGVSTGILHIKGISACPAPTCDAWNTDSRNLQGTMLLHVAASHNAGAMVTWLLGKGVDASVKDGDGKTAKQIAKKNNCKKSLEALPD